MGLPWAVANNCPASDALEWFEAKGELNDLIAGKGKSTTYKVRRKKKP